MKWLMLILFAFLAGCSEKANHRWLGYAEGDYIYVSAPQAGWIVKLNVKLGNQVKQGEKLFSLDDVSQIAARNQASAQVAQVQAQMNQARADLRLAQKELRRQQGLLRKNLTSKQNYDLAESNYDTASAQIGRVTASEAEARATLSNAEYQLSQREIITRTNGRVENIYFRQGEYAPAMTPVLEILPPDNIYVRFFVPEDDFAKIHLGENVQIGCDSCRVPIKAKITFIAKQEEFTPPVIFSQDNRSKLSFKVEASASGGLKLNPGQPVDVRPVR